MQPHEAADVATLFHDAWHETQAPLQHPLKARHRDNQFFLDRLEGRAQTIVARSKGELVGFASYTKNKLNSLFLVNKFRNLGIGLALLQRAENDMRANGHVVLELDCVEHNDAARRFYERHGWRLQKTFVDERQKPEGVIFQNIWLMVKS